MIKSTIILYLLNTIHAPMGWRIAAYATLAWELVKGIIKIRSFCRGFVLRWKVRKAMKK